MAEFSTVKESEAPARPRSAGRLNDRMRQYESFVGQVGRSQVGMLVPDNDETPRGVALRINRAARRIGQSVETWVVGGVVYFRKGRP
jgi:hypothetical protein